MSMAVKPASVGCDSGQLNSQPAHRRVNNRRGRTLVASPNRRWQSVPTRSRPLWRSSFQDMLRKMTGSRVRPFTSRSSPCRSFRRRGRQSWDGVSCSHRFLPRVWQSRCTHPAGDPMSGCCSRSSGLGLHSPSGSGARGETLGVSAPRRTQDRD